MLFNSLNFIIFFPITLAIYYILPKKIRQYWLLIASYYFYMCWNAEYAVLLLFSTAVTYSSGLLIEGLKKKTASGKNIILQKKLIVAISFMLNIGLLCYFKYTNFALGLISDIAGFFHISVTFPTFDILLPVGISFYIFQSLSYTMDVYRDEIYAEKNFFRYALFVSFFPQLVAGPIERSKNLLKQLATPKPFNFDRFRDGFLLMLWGYFIKVVVADRIAIFVDRVYGNTEGYPGAYLILASIFFAFQIYCDFSGYSIIAMGCARILGIELMENFNAPYLSETVAQFWRNWHISLTSWFRDYLYIPLGGSRCKTFRKHLNVLIVFLASGLWHGASLSFIIWGGLNGIFQIIGSFLKPIRDRLLAFTGKTAAMVFLRRIAAILTTFILVDFAWIFFRAGSAALALHIIKDIFAADNLQILFDGGLYKAGLDDRSFWFMIFSILVIIIADILKKRGVVVRYVVIRRRLLIRSLLTALFIFIILTFGVWGPGYDATEFIYFAF